MPTQFTAQVTGDRFTQHSEGYNAGDWYLVRVLHRPVFGDFVELLARKSAPNGWSVVPDNAASPTAITITAPLDLKDFGLRDGFLQNGPDYNEDTGYGLDNHNTINAPIPYSISYQLYLKSSVEELRPFTGGFLRMSSMQYIGEWNVISYGPRAILDPESEGTFDGSPSVPGGRMIAKGTTADTPIYLPLTGHIVKYEWEARDIGPPLGPVVATGTGPIFEPGEGDYEITLTVTNNFGKIGYTKIIAEGGDRVSALADGDGVGYAAVVEGGTLYVKEYVNGQASETVKFALPGYDSPSLYQIQGWTRFHLTAREKSTGRARQFLSDDHCGNFAEVF